MSKVIIYEVNVMFGDCDPAGIVLFPNFAKWMDASSLHFFMKCGVRPWRELIKTTGVFGAPLLEIQVKFMRPATYGETPQIHINIQEWRNKAFLFRHVIMRGEDVLCEGIETRAFCIRLPGEDRIRAIAVPEDIKALCL